MGCFNLTASLIIKFLFFKRRDLRVAQYDAVTGYFVFESFESFFEVLKIMPKPDRTNAATGDKDSFFA